MARPTGFQGYSSLSNTMEVLRYLFFITPLFAAVDLTNLPDCKILSPEYDDLALSHGAAYLEGELMQSIWESPVEWHEVEARCTATGLIRSYGTQVCYAHQPDAVATWARYLFGRPSNNFNRHEIVATKKQSNPLNSMSPIHIVKLIKAVFEADRDVKNSVEMASIKTALADSIAWIKDHSVFQEALRRKSQQREDIKEHIRDVQMCKDFVNHRDLPLPTEPYMSNVRLRTLLSRLLQVKGDNRPPLEQNLFAPLTWFCGFSPEKDISEDIDNASHLLPEELLKDLRVANENAKLSRINASRLRKRMVAHEVQLSEMIQKNASSSIIQKKSEIIQQEKMQLSLLDDTGSTVKLLEKFNIDGRIFKDINPVLEKLRRKNDKLIRELSISLKTYQDLLKERSQSKLKEKLALLDKRIKSLGAYLLKKSQKIKLNGLRLADIDSDLGNLLRLHNEWNQDLNDAALKAIGFVPDEKIGNLIEELISNIRSKEDVKTVLDLIGVDIIDETFRAEILEINSLAKLSNKIAKDLNKEQVRLEKELADIGDPVFIVAEMVRMSDFVLDAIAEANRGKLNYPPNAPLALLQAYALAKSPAFSYFPYCRALQRLFPKCQFDTEETVDSSLPFEVPFDITSSQLGIYMAQNASIDIHKISIGTIEIHPHVSFTLCNEMDYFKVVYFLLLSPITRKLDFDYAKGMSWSIDETVLELLKKDTRADLLAAAEKFVLLLQNQPGVYYNRLLIIDRPEGYERFSQGECKLYGFLASSNGVNNGKDESYTVKEICGKTYGVSRAGSIAYEVGRGYRNYLSVLRIILSLSHIPTTFVFDHSLEEAIAVLSKSSGLDMGLQTDSDGNQIIFLKCRAAVITFRVDDEAHNSVKFQIIKLAPTFSVDRKHLESSNCSNAYRELAAVFYRKVGPPKYSKEEEKRCPFYRFVCDNPRPFPQNIGDLLSSTQYIDPSVIHQILSQEAGGEDQIGNYLVNHPTVSQALKRFKFKEMI